MVRITLYDPQISADVYSQRRAAERAPGSRVAEGLGRLGRALTARAEREAPGNQDRTQALHALAKLRREELARLREDLKPGAADPQGSGGGFLRGHMERRDAVLRALAERNPRSARLVAEQAGALTEDLARRATVFEAANIGDALAADINAALTDAIETVRIDPTQREAVQEEFRATLTALAEDGVDEGAVATLMDAADRGIANAAFEGRVAEDPEAAREELAAGEFGDGLPAEEAEARRAKADHAVRVRRLSADADARVAEHAYRTRFEDYLRLLASGEAAQDDAFSEEAIRDRMSADVAGVMIEQLKEATAIAAALAEIQFMSRTQIAGANTGRAYTRAAQLRARLLDQDPAAFALRNSEVRSRYDDWMQARADGDLTAAVEAGRDFTSETLDLQRHMDVAESDLRILPDDLAGALVADFMDRGGPGPGPVALGRGLSEQLGDHWRISIGDLVRAGLPEAHAVLAQMQARDQRRAAEQLWSEFGTTVEDLREAAGSAGDEILRVHTAMLNDVRSWDGTEPIEPDGAQAQQALRRAYLLGRDGVPPAAAVRRALSDVTLTREQYAWVHGPAGRVGPQEARSLAQSGALAFMLGIDPALVRSGGSTARRALAELGRLPELDQSGRQRLLQTILSLGADTPIGMQMLDAFDRLTQAPDRPAQAGVRAAPQDMLPVSPIIPRLVTELEEFQGLDPVGRGRRMRHHFESRHLRQAMPLIEDLEGTLGFVDQALLSDDPAVQMYGVMIASDLARAAPSVRREEHIAVGGAALDEGSLADGDRGEEAPALETILGRLSPEALDTYDRIVNDWFRSRAPMDLGPERISDRFVIDHARELAGESRWPEGEEQIVEFALLISRASQANDRQFDALVQRMVLTVTPRDPDLARQLVAAARAARVPPGTMLRTPSGGVVLEPGGLGGISAEAVPFLSADQLVLAWLALEPTRDALPGANTVPPPPPGFSSRFRDGGQLFQLFEDIHDTASARSRPALLRQAFRMVNRWFGLHEDMERQDLVYLIRLSIYIRQSEDSKAGKEFERLWRMQKDAVNFANAQATTGSGRPAVAGDIQDTTVR